MNPPKRASATAVKNRFGDFLGEVVHGDRPLVIERHGRPVAVLVPFQQWEENPRSGNPLIQTYQRLMEQLLKQTVDQPQTPAETLLKQVRSEEGA